MDFIKQWTLTISATLIISIIFSLLTPKGNMGRFFKVVLAMFIFVSFIYPIKNADFDFVLPSFDEAEFEDSQQSSYEKIIETNLIQILEEGNYINSKVNVNISIKNEEITVNNLDIGILDEFDKREVMNYIEEKTGFHAEVYYLGE